MRGELKAVGARSLLVIVDGGYEQEGYPRGQLQLNPICSSLRETEKFIIYLTGVENDQENQFPDNDHYVVCDTKWYLSHHMSPPTGNLVARMFQSHADISY